MGRGKVIGNPETGPRIFAVGCWRLAATKTRLSELMESEFSQLYAKFGQAEKDGRDLLQELAESIGGKIKYAQERLQQLAASDAS